MKKTKLIGRIARIESKIATLGKDLEKEYDKGYYTTYKVRLMEASLADMYKDKLR